MLLSRLVLVVLTASTATGALAAEQGPPRPRSTAGAPAHASSSSQATKAMRWQWYAFATSGQLADAWTSRRFRALGIAEAAHPLIGPDAPAAAFYGYKSAVGIGVAALGSWIDVEGQRRKSRSLRIVGRALPIVSGGLGFAAGIHNERAIARAQSAKR